MMTRSTVLKYGGIIAILAIIIPSIVFAFASQTPQSQPTTTGIKMYMTIQSSSQGVIEGGCVLAGHEGQMEVLSMHHQVSSSLEGRTVHGELRITKYIDKASPKLAKALSNGEVLVEMVLRFYRPSPTGAYEHYYTIKLEDAIITSIETHAMDNGRHMEEVSFSYMQITWTDEVNGIEFIDDLGATT